MAQKIAEKLSQNKRPTVVERIFSRAISARHRVTAWFMEPASPEGKPSSDQRHLHFIGVLESAFTTLFPFTEVTKKAGRLEPSGTVRTQSLPLHNTFAGLKVEDLSDDLQDMEPDTNSPSRRDESVPKIASVTLEKEQTEVEEEFIFAIQCFVKETYAIWLLVKQVWSVYEETGDDLMIASIMTNTAIGKRSNRRILAKRKTC